MGLNIADVSILILLLFSIFISVYRGFTREFITAITWIVAGTVAYIFGESFGQTLTFIDSNVGKEILGTVLIFMGVLIICYAVKILLFKVFKISGISVVDRLLGGVFGLFRGSVVVIAVLLLATENIKEQEWYKKSRLLPTFNKIADAIAKATPESWKKELSKEVDQATKAEGDVINNAVKSEVQKQQQQLQQQTPQTTQPAAVQQPTNAQPSTPPPSTTKKN